jgi:hypothetical protein
MITSDKTLWPEGPWKQENDFYEWTDDETGLLCRILRNGSGSLCGYVGILEASSFYGKSYDEAQMLDCHGGLTFSGRMEGVPEWFLGFDCAHAGDFSPRYGDKYSMAGETYRDVAYVREQVKDLAKQMSSPLEQLASS